MYKIKVGISACLLGQEVRFDGGHKRSSFCERDLGAHFEYHPVCPEMAIGLGAPRAAIRLVKRHGEVRAEASNGSFDVTERLIAFSEQKARLLDFISGYILCAKSPSCGMERVRIYGANNEGSAKEGIGLFAKALMEANPLLPVEEDGRLNDGRLRENFIESVFVCKHFRDLTAVPPSRGALVDFHTRHKLLFLARSQEHYRRMGRFIANLPASIDEAYSQYSTLLADTLRVRTTAKKHCNVLLHVLGYFKKMLSADEKQEALELIEAYRTADVPLIVPITLLNHFVRKYDQPYLRDQYYLRPHPLDLRLRSHC